MARHGGGGGHRRADQVGAAAGALPAWGYIGIVPLATGLMGWCPLYPLLGMNTCPTKK